MPTCPCNLSTALLVKYVEAAASLCAGENVQVCSCLASLHDTVADYDSQYRHGKVGGGSPDAKRQQHK